MAGPVLATAAVLPAAAAAKAPGAVVCGLAAAALGGYDDLYGDRHARGLRGHWRALRRGEVTTGAIKMAGLVAAAAAVSAAERRSLPAVAGDVVLIAGTANLVNLLDLRPGRALKVATAVAAPLTMRAGARGVVAAGVAGAALATVPGDIRERDMIGDCGANSVGALIGWCLAQAGSHRARAASAAVVVLLTVASERVSFTEVIDATPVLRALDRAGRPR